MFFFAFFSMFWKVFINGMLLCHGSWRLGLLTALSWNTFLGFLCATFGQNTSHTPSPKQKLPCPKPSWRTGLTSQSQGKHINVVNKGERKKVYGKVFPSCSSPPIFYSIEQGIYLCYSFIWFTWWWSEDGKRFFKLPKKFRGKLGNIKNAFQCPKGKKWPEMQGNEYFVQKT